ncbi:MAG TPA: DUF2141 domain-containing protein [Cyclobacteriaceae bacterium]|nr:DUF2141 domain-containing protein [Cyclobacteriaceae bacterium]
MKKLTVSVMLMVGMLSAYNMVAQGKLELTIKNIKEVKGTIRVSLFNNENDFLKQAVVSKVVKVSAAEASVVFDNLRPGEYAVSVIHDVNGNQELDKGFMGIPQEPYGFSNDARGKFGPPSYEESKLNVTGIVKTSIKVE